MHHLGTPQSQNTAANPPKLNLLYSAVGMHHVHHTLILSEALTFLIC